MPRFSKQDYAGQRRFKTDCCWPLCQIVRIPTHGAVSRLGAPRGAVVPIRQFCEVKKPDAVTRAASFLHIGGISFDTLPDGRLPESPPTTSAKSTVTTRRLPRMTGGRILPQQRGDLNDQIRDVYLQEALEDEANLLLRCVYNDDRPNGLGGGSKQNFWVNGNTGSDVDGDSFIDGDAEASLTCKGLFAARKKIRDHDFGADYAVCYTTATALADLKCDPDFERRGGRPLDAGVTTGDTAVIDGMLLVTTPLLAPPACGVRDAGARSVMFVPNVSFGLVSDDMVTVTSGWDATSGYCHVGHHLVGGAVIAASSTCRISHI